MLLITLVIFIYCTGLFKYKLFLHTAQKKSLWMLWFCVWIKSYFFASQHLYSYLPHI
jgi:hypothetical protein